MTLETKFALEAANLRNSLQELDLTNHTESGTSSLTAAIAREFPMREQRGQRGGLSIV